MVPQNLVLDTLFSCLLLGFHVVWFHFVRNRVHCPEGLHAVKTTQLDAYSA
jgi:hypothetical protein